jgi:Tfp pilus assembly protein PilF
MDDDYVVVDNPLIRDFRLLPRVLSTDYWSREGSSDRSAPHATGLYRPLTITSYTVNYAMFGLQPWAFHLTNVVLHLLITCLIYLFALRIHLSLKAAVIVAATFGLHPLHTEAVTSIVGRAELLMSLCVLSGLWLAADARFGLSLIAFALGLLSKEQAVMLPVLILLYESCAIAPLQRRSTETEHSRSSLRILFTEYWPYAVVLSGYLVLRWWALGGLALAPIPFLDNPIAYLNGTERLLTAIRVAGKYLWLCIWPASLSVDYSYNAIPSPHSPLEYPALLSLAAWGMLTILMIQAYFVGDRRTAFCIGFTVVTFIPVSNLFIPIGTIMGERLFYLPSVGLCLLLGLGWDKLSQAWKRHRFIHPLALVLMTVICASLFGRTIMRNKDWANNATLWKSAESVVPSSAKIQQYFGRQAQAEGEWSEALRRYRKALEIYPDYQATDTALNINLGDVHYKLGNLAEAATALERAVSLSPQSSSAQYNLGLVQARMGHYQKAEVSIRKALDLKPQFPEANNTLARLLLEMGRGEESLAAANSALQQRPEFPAAHYNRGLALKALGRKSEADIEFQRALDNPIHQGSVH